jgi:hypothetical protein
MTLSRVAAIGLVIGACATTVPKADLIVPPAGLVPPKRAPRGDPTRDAQADLAAGSLRLYVGGVPASILIRSMPLFKERLGVDLELSGCGPDDDWLDYKQTYNEVVVAHLEAKHGKGVIKEVLAEAKELHRVEMERLRAIEPAVVQVVLDDPQLDRYLRLDARAEQGTLTLLYFDDPPLTNLVRSGRPVIVTSQFEPETPSISLLYLDLEADSVVVALGNTAAEVIARYRLVPDGDGWRITERNTSKTESLPQR